MKYLVVILSTLLVSCEKSESALLQANTSTINNPRSLLENSSSSNKRNKLYYFDREDKILYSLGTRIDGFSFSEVKMVELKNQKPGVYAIVECAKGKRCASSNFEHCQMTIPLSKPVAAERQNQIVKIMKSRGYPVVRVEFLTVGSTLGEMEVQYFTECDYINRDVAENFPDLMVGPNVR